MTHESLYGPACCSSQRQQGNVEESLLGKALSAGCTEEFRSLENRGSAVTPYQTSSFPPEQPWGELLVAWHLPADGVLISKVAIGDEAEP